MGRTGCQRGLWQKENCERRLRGGTGLDYRSHFSWHPEPRLPKKALAVSEQWRSWILDCKSYNEKRASLFLWWGREIESIFFWWRNPLPCIWRIGNQNKWLARLKIQIQGFEDSNAGIWFKGLKFVIRRHPFAYLSVISPQVACGMDGHGNGRGDFRLWFTS